MKYLCLRFENAGLISSKEKHVVKDSTGHYKNKEYRGKEIGGHDMKTPIPYTLLSGVLHKLCGEIPVPSKRQTFLERIAVLDEIAKKSYVNYDIKPILNEKGYVTNAETFVTSKCHYNSHQKAYTEFTLYDGSVVNFNGRYTWDYLRRTFDSADNFDRLCSFISGIIDDNCEKYTMPQLVKKLSFYWGEDEFDKKVDEFLFENKQISSELKSAWKKTLFGKHATGNNTAYTSRTPLLYGHGIAKICYISGDIICPIDDERVIQALSENGGIASILEGGFVYITGLENYEPVPNFKEKWEKIFNENNAETTETESDK